jgi:hypothetical protein
MLISSQTVRQHTLHHAYFVIFGLSKIDSTKQAQGKNKLNNQGFCSMGREKNPTPCHVTACG